MIPFAFLDGVFILETDAKIGISNRGFLFGDGAYATIQVKDGKPFFLKTHLKRLEKQCLAFGMTPPTISEEDVFELIERNGAFKGVYKLKIIVTGDDEPLMRLPKRKWGHLIMTLHSFQVPAYKPLKMGIFPHPIMSAHATFKSLAHLNRYFVMEYADSMGCDDALTKTESGLLLEASFGNLIWFHDGVLFTPDKSLPIHQGVTVGEVMESVQEEGIECRFVKTTLDALPKEAIVFRTNTMSGIRPIEKIEEKVFKRDLKLEEFLLKKYERTTIKKSDAILSAAL